MRVPKLRFKEFGGNWEEKKLSEISDIKTGPFGSTLHEEDYVQVGTPIITVEHLGEQGVVYINLPQVSDEDKTRLKSYHLKEGDVVFSRVGSVDRSCLISSKENGWLFSGRLLRVRLTNGNFNPKFLNQNFKNETVKHRIRSAAVGQTMASLNTEILKNFHLKFPPSFPEQTKIANFLAAIDEKITLLTQKHDLLKQYKKGVMQQIFSQKLRFKDDDGREFPEWEEKKLKDVFSIKYGKDHKHLEEGNIPLLGTGGIMKYVNQHIYDKPSVLIGRKGTIDKPQFIETPFWTVDTLFYTEINENYAPYFVYLLVSQVDWYKYNEATGVPSLNTTAINNIGVRIPPDIKEQTKIANFLTAIDDKITQTQTQLEAVKQYKKGLLQRMFV